MRTLLIFFFAFVAMAAAQGEGVNVVDADQVHVVDKVSFDNNPSRVHVVENSFDNSPSHGVNVVENSYDNNPPSHGVNIVENSYDNNPSHGVQYPDSFQLVNIDQAFYQPHANGAGGSGFETPDISPAFVNQPPYPYKQHQNPLARGGR